MKKLLTFPILLALSTFALVSCDPGEDDLDDRVEDRVEEAEDALDDAE